MNQDLRRSAPRPSKKEYKGHVPDRWPYWLAKAADDPRWKRVTIGGLVKLSYETSVDAVTTAMSFAFEEGSPLALENPYGWIRNVAHDLHGKPMAEWASLDVEKWAG